MTGLGVVVAITTWGCSKEPAEPPKPDVITEIKKLNVPSLPKEFTPEQVQQLERGWQGRGQYFIRTGCVACHSVSVYDVTALASVGPDLSNAVEDVQSRFGRTIEDFFHEPQGTMQMVLTQVLVLTPEQKAEALEHLHEAFAEYQRSRGGAGQPSTEQKRSER
jgi:cytochrome c1